MKPVTEAILDLFGSAHSLEQPSGYRGLAAFHKYWGKKPLDSLEYLVNLLSKPGDLIVDPFLGFGLLARRVALLDRKFVGIDINPISIQLATLFLTPPDWREYANALKRIEEKVRPSIEDSYRLEDGRTATHYLWNGETLASVWIAGKKGTARVEMAPTKHDLRMVKQYADCKTDLLRAPRFFKNSRINVNTDLTFKNIFAGRALRNIDLLLKTIAEEPESLRRALLLTLTSSVGQMSKMVFAISKRGKVVGSTAEKMEVGSWVIGYWRPRVHFEVNVWNTYLNRANRLRKALKEELTPQQIHPVYDVRHFYSGGSQVCLVNGDCRSTLQSMIGDSVDLMITDPPHSDRIPYLELSEMWNCILGESPDFENEIVVSNAPKRRKNKEMYNLDMGDFMDKASLVLGEGGLLALMFNARDDKSWTYFHSYTSGQKPLTFLGTFPIKYSAASVVQDNRGGALKYDYILVFAKGGPRTGIVERLASISGWTNSMPRNGD